MNLNFNYSPESEADRIGYTLEKYNWYKENRYRINLPKNIKEKAEKSEFANDKEIADAVKEEYSTNDYENAANLLALEFKSIENLFVNNLKTLGGPVHDSYEVHITKYGVGGSYGLPNKIQINIDYGRTISWITLAHEIVHLTIEDWIREHKIPHWSKERIVDLIMNKFFPGQINIQGKLDEHEEVNIIFDSYFPDIKKVIENL